MLLSEVLARLAVLPDPLPPAPAALDARVLASLDRAPEWVRRSGAPATRDAAALVLLYPDEDGEAWLVLTERPPGTHRHAGQIALPGGKRDPGDEFPVGTALREAAEEVGLDVAGRGRAGAGPARDGRRARVGLHAGAGAGDGRPATHPARRRTRGGQHHPRAGARLPAGCAHRDRGGGTRRLAPPLRRLSHRRAPGLGRDGKVLGQLGRC